jgi:GTP cyclohydrolase I
MLDNESIKQAVITMIKAIGDDPEREGLAGTPERVADMYSEIFMGMNIDPRSVLDIEFDESHREMVIIRDIPFYSMCEHHLLPFFGTADVGYIPNEKGRVVGASKIARVVEIVARRPQIQERMTSQIADAIDEGISPSGVGVVIQAEHLCMMMRGIRKPGSSMQTSALRGTFRSKPSTRAEFLSLINSR